VRSIGFVINMPLPIDLYADRDAKDKLTSAMDLGDIEEGVESEFKFYVKNRGTRDISDLTITSNDKDMTVESVSPSYLAPNAVSTVTIKILSSADRELPFEGMLKFRGKVRPRSIPFK